MVPLVHPKQRWAGGCRAPVACLAFCRDFATVVAASDALRTGMCVCYCTFSACWRGGCQCLRCLPRGQLALCRSLQRARTCGPTWVWLSGECAAANEPGAMPRLQQRDEAFVPVWHCLATRTSDEHCFVSRPGSLMFSKQCAVIQHRSGCLADCCQLRQSARTCWASLFCVACTCHSDSRLGVVGYHVCILLFCGSQGVSGLLVGHRVKPVGHCVLESG